MKRFERVSLSHGKKKKGQSTSASYESEEFKLADGFTMPRHSRDLYKHMKSYKGQLEILNEQLKLKDKTIREKNEDIQNTKQQLDLIKQNHEQITRQSPESEKHIDNYILSDSIESTSFNSSVDRTLTNFPENNKNPKDNELWIKKKLLENEVKLLNSKINTLKTEKSRDLDEIRQLKLNLAQTRTEKQIIVEEKDKIITSFELEIDSLKDKEKKYRHRIIDKKTKLQKKKKKSKLMKERMKILKARETKHTQEISTLEKKVESLKNQLFAKREQVPGSYHEKLNSLQAKNVYLMSQLITLKSKQHPNHQDSSPSNCTFQRENVDCLKQIRQRLVSIYRKYLTQGRLDQSHYLLTPIQFASIEKQINDLISFVHDKENSAQKIYNNEFSAPSTARDTNNTFVSNSECFY